MIVTLKETIWPVLNIGSNCPMGLHPRNILRNTSHIPLIHPRTDFLLTVLTVLLLYYTGRPLFACFMSKKPVWLLAICLWSNKSFGCMCLCPQATRINYLPGRGAEHCDVSFCPDMVGRHYVCCGCCTLTRSDERGFSPRRNDLSRANPVKEAWFCADVLEFWVTVKDCFFLFSPSLHARQWMAILFCMKVDIWFGVTGKHSSLQSIGFSCRV